MSGNKGDEIVSDDHLIKIVFACYLLPDMGVSFDDGTHFPDFL